MTSTKRKKKNQKRKRKRKCKSCKIGMLSAKKAKKVMETTGLSNPLKRILPTLNQLLKRKPQKLKVLMKLLSRIRLMHQ